MGVDEFGLMLATSPDRVVSTSMMTSPFFLKPISFFLSDQSTVQDDSPLSFSRASRDQLILVIPSVSFGKTGLSTK